MITLTSAATVVRPITLSDYSADRDSGAIVHPILGRAYPEVTFRPMSMRSGRFTLDFPTEAAANGAFSALRQSGLWTLRHDDVASMNMTFVISGASLNIAGDGRYPVEVSFTEVSVST